MKRKWGKCNIIFLDRKFRTNLYSLHFQQILFMISNKQKVFCIAIYWSIQVKWILDNDSWVLRQYWDEIVKTRRVFDSVTNFTFSACKGPNLVNMNKSGYKIHINHKVLKHKIIKMQLSDTKSESGFRNYFTQKRYFFHKYCQSSFQILSEHAQRPYQS